MKTLLTQSPRMAEIYRPSSRPIIGDHVGQDCTGNHRWDIHNIPVKYSWLTSEFYNTQINEMPQRMLFFSSSPN